MFYGVDKRTCIYIAVSERVSTGTRQLVILEFALIGILCRVIRHFSVSVSVHLIYIADIEIAV